jgi:hypothetical protein
LSEKKVRSAVMIIKSALQKKALALLALPILFWLDGIVPEESIV